MSLKNLINKTIDATVNEADGIAEDIIYINRSNIQTSLKSIVEFKQLEDAKSKKVVNDLVFHGLTLPNKPIIGDIVVYENERYVVDSYTCISDRYDVTCTKARHYRGA
jgi:hypothetical protein